MELRMLVYFVLVEDIEQNKNEECVDKLKNR